MDLPRGAAPHRSALSSKDETTQGSGGPGRTRAARAGRAGASTAPGNLFSCGRPAGASLVDRSRLLRHMDAEGLPRACRCSGQGA